MNERIKEFIQLEGLTAVKFAEIMEVQPSSISHLLSGRNYPNYDFLSKILLRFPRLSPDWIINGKGEVYRSNSTDDTVVTQNDTLSRGEEVTYVNQLKTVQQGTETAQAELVEALITNVKDVENELDSDRTHYPESDITNVTQKHFSRELSDPHSTSADINVKDYSGASKIDQIVIFYSDGTFKEYNNRK